eukprot:jgi/Bigna1/144000/aug1.83_g18708
MVDFLHKNALYLKDAVEAELLGRNLARTSHLCWVVHNSLITQGWSQYAAAEDYKTNKEILRGAAMVAQSVNLVVDLNLLEKNVGEIELQIRAHLKRSKAKVSSSGTFDDVEAVLASMNTTLFQKLGFRRPNNYYAVTSNLLPSVLLKREGQPIALSVLYIALARRLGLDARGVNTPRHFIVAVSTKVKADANRGREGKSNNREEASDDDVEAKYGKKAEGIVGGGGRGFGMSGKGGAPSRTPRNEYLFVDVFSKGRVFRGRSQLDKFFHDAVGVDISDSKLEPIEDPLIFVRM